MNLEETQKTLRRLGKIEYAKAKLADKQGIVAKIKGTLKQAEVDVFHAEFELEILLRKGKLEETFWRFPHLAEQIFDEIDDQNLVKCREVNKWWQRFIDGPKILSMRVLQMHFCLPKPILLKKFQQNDFKKTIKELENDVVKAGNHESTRKAICETISADRKQIKLFANAAELGFLEICQILIDHLENKNPMNLGGYTPLHEAARYGYFEICMLIIETLIDKNPKSILGITPLHLAACAPSNSFEICKLIIATLDNKNPEDVNGTTPFHYAAEYGNTEVCKLIMKKLQNKNPTRNDGETPLHWAASSGKFETCRLIMETLENKNPSNEYGMTPLHMALLKGHIEIFKLIMKILIEKNPKTNSGRTPLHIAASNGNFEVCQLIVDTLENKNPEKEDGLTPLHLAAENGHLEICKLIMENLTEKSPVDKDGWTPLELASGNGHKEICELFKSFQDNEKDKNVRGPPKKRSRKNTPKTAHPT